MKPLMRSHLFHRHLATLFFLVVAATKVCGQTTPARPITESFIKIDLAKTEEEMKPIWAWFGYDEPNYTYMKDGKKLLSEIAALSPVPVYVRCHSLLVTGDGRPSLKW